MMKWKIGGLVVAILVIGLVLMVPVNVQEIYEATETYIEKEPYTATETYYVKEPYETTETYYETEPYTDYVPLSYTPSSWYYYNHVWTDEFDLMITVKNTDNVGGRFWVTFHAVGTEGIYDSTTNSVFLMPGESYEFKHTFSGTHLSGCGYDVYRTTKEVTKYHDVPKERTVTKYHDVLKERTVLKTRTVQKPIYEITYSFFLP